MKTKPHFLGVIISLFTCISCLWLVTGIDTATDTAKLRELEQRVFLQNQQEYPEWGTFNGFHDYDNVLESYTLEAYARRKNSCEEILKEIKTINRTNLSSEDRRNLKLLLSYVETYVDGFKWRDYGNLSPINFLEGFAKGPQWVFAGKYKKETDYANYFQRLSAIPKQIDEQIALMERAIELKRTYHGVSLTKIPESLGHWSLQGAFYFPFRELLEQSDIPKSQWKHIREEAQGHMINIENSLKKLKRFIANDYLRASRRQEGLHAMYMGLDYYQACLKWHLGVDLSPAEVHEIGVQELNRIQKEMKRVMNSLGFRGDLKAFLKHLKTIPHLYNKTKGQLIQRYQRIIENDIFPKLQQVFHDFHVDPVAVVGLDNGPWASYGNKTFFVNLHESEKRSTFTMIPLALHEANPGHHFQVSFLETQNIPDYRRKKLYGKWHAVPLLFPTYTAFSEGWALYAEYLGEELGLYEDPYDLFGRYCSEIFRACRLIVDTGIHAFGWNRHKAISFIGNYTDFPYSQIATEVDRYITWPGQACSYKIGEIKIKQLRQKAENMLGNLFDIKEFHEQVLKSGSIPLVILEEIIDEWIDSLLPEKSSPSYRVQRVIEASRTSHQGTSHTDLTCSVNFSVLCIVTVVTLYGQIHL